MKKPSSLILTAIFLPVGQLSAQTGTSTSQTLYNPSTRPYASGQQGESVALGGNLAVIGSPGDASGGVVGGGAVKIYERSTGALLHILRKPGAVASDVFGTSVAISGNRVAVGVPYDDTGASNSGAVYVFDLGTLSPTVPTLVIHNPAPGAEDRFGSTVAISGNRLVIGAHLDDTGATNAGSVYVFDVSSPNPENPQVAIHNPSPASGDEFARSISLSGSRLVAGVPNDDSGASNAGLAYVFDLDGGNPQTPAIIISNPSPSSSNQFGSAVAVAGNRLVVGVPNKIVGTISGAGIAYVFDLIGGNASVKALLANPEPGGSDQFGSAVAVSGNRVVIGAADDDAGATNAGSVYVFNPDGGAPTAVKMTLPNPGAASNERFGAALAIADGVLLIGAPRDGGGSAFLHEVGGLIPVAGPVLAHAGLATGEQFGTTVAVSGVRVAVGTPNDGTLGNNTGRVYVYNRASITPEVPELIIESPVGSGNQFGNALAFAGDRLVVGIRLDDRDGDNSGRVCVYDLGGTTPGLPVLTLGSPFPVAFAQFGTSVALDGNRLIVGIPYFNAPGASSAGAICIFNLASASPTLPTEFIPNPKPSVSDQFGWSTAISGRHAVAGEFNGGSVFVFDLDGSAPSNSIAELRNPATATGGFGKSVAVSGDLVVVGAPGTSSSVGSAFVFDLESAAPAIPLLELPNPFPVASDIFGSAVAMTGNRIFVAAHQSDTGAANAGRVYGFELTSPTPVSPVWALNHPFPGVGDQLGISLAADRSLVVAGIPYHDTNGQDRGAACVFRLNDLPPSVTTGGAHGFTGAGATLTGTVNPNGRFTHAEFQYGTTTAYGSTAFAPLDPGDGTTATSVSAPLLTLTPGTLYHYRLMAISDIGTTYGPDRTFVAATPFSQNFATPASVPMTTASFTAAGKSVVGTTLGFHPAAGSSLTLVSVTGPSPVTGTFTNAPEGGGVTATHAGETLHFFISYQGGDGNDITLTRIAGPGQVPDTYVWSNYAGLAGGKGNVDGTGATARFNSALGIAVDTTGSVFVADNLNFVVRKVTAAGVVTTLAGSVGQQGTANGTGAEARFQQPDDVVVDAAGNVYVSDNSAIRKITPAGVVTTLAGMPGFSGSADGTGTTARFYGPRGLGIDSAGNIYVADTGNQTIRRVSPAGVVITVAGAPGNAGSNDGSAMVASFYIPTDVAADSSGNLFVADWGNDKIRKISSGGVVSTLAGGRGSADGTGLNAKFYNPRSVSVDGSGNVYVADATNHTVRKVTQSGVVTTLAGSAGNSGSVDATGSSARFRNPMSVAVSGSGSIHVIDFSHALRKVTPAGAVTTLAGVTGSTGTADGARAASRFNLPMDIAQDTAGNLLIADWENHTIRRISKAGTVTTLAGLAGAAGSADGTGTAARFFRPRGIAVDAAGNTYVADSDNHTVRKVTPDGVVSLAGGIPNTGGNTNGPSGTATLNTPKDVAVDAAGNVFVSTAHAIRRITPTGDISTFAGGSGSSSGSNDGSGTGARFNTPEGLAFDSAGNLLVADTSNNAIRRITPAGVVSTLKSGLGRPTQLTATAEGTIYFVEGGNCIIRRLSPSGTVDTIGGTIGWAGGNPGTGAAARFSFPNGIVSDPAGILFVADTNSNRIAQGLAAGFPPLVTTGAPTVDATSAILRGTVNGNGFNTTAWFEYGPSPSFGSTANVAVLPANRVSPGSVSAAVSGVFPGLTVHYRLCATNRDGTVSTVGSSFVASGPLDAHFATPGSIPFTADGFTASGIVLRNLSFGFTPQLGSVYTLVNNTGAGAVTGTFSGTLTATANGEKFSIAINYTGGDGNDITVTRTVGFSQLADYAWTDFAGQSGSPGDSDGSGPSARFRNPLGIAVGNNGDIFVADTGNHVVRRITPGGVVTTLAGAAGVSGSTDATGAAARFSAPESIAVDAGGNLFLADTGNHTIRMITSAGSTTTFAGLASSPGSANGSGASARFNSPAGIAINTDGTVAVADTGNHTIRKITAAGSVTTFAGSAGNPGSLDGTGAAARFLSPRGIAWGGSGVLYIADSANSTVRRSDSSGFTTTSYGIAGAHANVDGFGSNVRFNQPRGMARGPNDLPFVADFGNSSVRRVTQTGEVFSLAGGAGLDGPSGVAIADENIVYIADSNNHRIVKGTPVGSPPFVSLSAITHITRTSATVRVSVLPNGFLTSALMEFGETTGYGSAVPLSLSPVNGTISQNFTVNLTGLAPGTFYHCRISATNVDGTSRSVDQMFQTLTPAGFFAVAAGFESLTGDDALPNATPFNDGVENLLKYAFNMNLAGPDAKSMVVGGTSGLPAISQAGTGEEGVLRFEFVRRIGSGLDYTPKKSSTLDPAGWTTLGDTPTTIPIDANWERVIYEEPSNPSDVPSCFGRVEVTIPAP